MGLLLIHAAGSAPGRPLHRMPLLRTVCKHGTGLVIVRPETRRADAPRAGSFVAIVEDRPLSRGPAAFEPLALRALLRAVHGVVVNCDGSAAWPYRPTAALFSLGVSSLLVETTADHGMAWRAFVNRIAPGQPRRSSGSELRG